MQINLVLNNLNHNHRYHQNLTIYINIYNKKLDIKIFFNIFIYI